MTSRNAPFLFLLPLLSLFALLRGIHPLPANRSCSFCTNEDHPTGAILNPFVYRSRIFFRTPVYERESSAGQAMSSEVASNHSQGRLWHEFPLAPKPLSLSLKLLSTNELFGGLVENVDAAVVIPKVAFLQTSQFTFTNWPENDFAVFFVFSQGRYERTLLMMFRERTKFHLQLANEQMVSELRDFFTPAKNDSKQAPQGDIGSFNLLDGHTKVLSIAFDRQANLLVVLLPNSASPSPRQRLLVFNFTTRRWSFLTFEHTLPSKEFPSKKSRARSFSQINSILSTAETIIYVFRHLYIGVSGARLYLLKIVDKKEEKQGAYIDVQTSYLWRQFFNCYNDTPLIANVPKKEYTEYETDKEADTPSQPYAPLRPPDMRKEILQPFPFGSTEKPPSLFLVLISVTCLIVAFTFAAGIYVVTCRTIQSPYSPPNKQRHREPRRPSVSSLLSSSPPSSTETTAETISSSPEATSEKSPSKRRKTKKSRSSRRSKSSASSEKSTSTGDSKSSERSSSTGRLSLFGLSLFGESKTSSSGRSTSPRRRHRRRVGSGKGGSPVRDYSSKLSFFNQNSINRAVSRQTGVSTTSLRTNASSSSLRTSVSDLKSLKTIQVGGSFSSLSSSDSLTGRQPVLAPPDLEHNARRQYTLGYTVPDAEPPGGFTVKKMNLDRASKASHDEK